MERCKAKAKRTGDRCKNWPIRGGRVCRIHGGGAPQVRRAATQRREVARIEQELYDILGARMRREVGEQRAHRLHVAEVLGLAPDDPFTATHHAAVVAAAIEAWDRASG